MGASLAGFLFNPLTYHGLSDSSLRVGIKVTLQAARGYTTSVEEAHPEWGAGEAVFE